MENPEALGFHQEQQKQWKIQQKFQDWFCIKPYFILFTRENYYKFWLQYKIQNKITTSFGCNTKFKIKLLQVSVTIQNSKSKLLF